MKVPVCKVLEATARYKGKSVYLDVRLHKGVKFCFKLSGRQAKTLGYDTSHAANFALADNAIDAVLGRISERKGCADAR